MADFKDVFKGFDVSGTYVMETCPFCDDFLTARWQNGLQQIECIACKKFMFYDEFISWARKDIKYAEQMDSMTAPKGPDGIVDIGVYVEPKGTGLSIPSGFNELDRLLGGLHGGELTVLTGKRAEGKSTFAGQLALNCVHAGAPVYFYSGELSASSFQHWLFLQAAGSQHVNRYVDDFGGERWILDKEWAEPHIRAWLRGRIALYDNKVSSKGESNTIIDRARACQSHYGSKVFFVDNLKTARFKKDNERDYLRKQANFAADMLAFAVETNTHVFLIAHPKKDDTGDANDNVAGLSDITDLAHNVLRIRRISEKEQKEVGYPVVLEVTKNRRYGKNGLIPMSFDESCKRFVTIIGSCIKTYRWEVDV